jgi:DNA-binding response OmpR family regulator
MEKIPDLHGKILIADDEVINVNFFQVMLTKLGFEVDVAYDGEEVLEKVNTFTPDLILLDLLMPKLSGFQVAEILKGDENTKEIPIVVLSAVSDIKDKVDMLELGIEDYITKPFNFVEILARIRNILRAKSLKSEIKSQQSRFQKFSDLEKYLGDFLKEAGQQSEELIDSGKKLLGNSSENEEHSLQVIGVAEKLSKSIDKLKELYSNFTRVAAEEGAGELNH